MQQYRIVSGQQEKLHLLDITFSPELLDEAEYDQKNYVRQVRCYLRGDRTAQALHDSSNHKKAESNF